MDQQPLWKRYRSRLEALRAAELNFDLSRRHLFTKERGWHIDNYEAELPPEAPGPPAAGGSWEIAQRLMREYKFADPGIVTGIYYPDRPLAERVMLLRARFLFFTFYFGVRIGEVIDEVRKSQEGRYRIWGFNYRTLEGHFERGQMDFQIVKHLESGRVFFRIHAFSQPAHIPNLFYRIGFLLFGRRLQRRFARRSIARLQRLVTEQLAAAARHEPAPSVEGPEIRPAGEKKEVEREMEKVQEQAQQPPR